MDITKKWYAIYTRPRWEKKVAEKLNSAGITVYCPINKVSRKWSDRYKVVEEPLFKSYLFVQITEKEVVKVRAVHGVVNFIYWNNKPAIIKDADINTIKRFLREHTTGEIIVADIKESQRVKIINGVFMDVEAVVMRADKHKVQVVLDSLGVKLIALLDKKDVEVI